MLAGGHASEDKDASVVEGQQAPSHRQLAAKPPLVGLQNGQRSVATTASTDAPKIRTGAICRAASTRRFILAIVSSLGLFGKRRHPTTDLSIFRWHDEAVPSV